MAASAGDIATLLPDDVLVEILSRLPGRSVLRFCTVCRSWCALLSDPSFVPTSALPAVSSSAATTLPAAWSTMCTTPSTRSRCTCRCGYIDGVDRPLYLHGCCEGLLLLSHRNRPVRRPCLRRPQPSCRFRTFTGWRTDGRATRFRTMRLPPEESETTSRSKIIWNLAPIDGALGAWSFAEFEHRVLRMWVLEDHEEERWALREGLALAEDLTLVRVLVASNGRVVVFDIKEKATGRTNVTLPRDLNWNLAVAGFYFHAPTAEYRVLCYRCDRTEHVRHVPPRERETVTRKHYDYSVAAVGRPEVSRLASTT
ncbi:hypothetical protein ACQ4PT_059829 [Festuca glaucescens]